MSLLAVLPQQGDSIAAAAAAAAVAGHDVSEAAHELRFTDTDKSRGVLPQATASYLAFGDSNTKCNVLTDPTWGYPYLIANGTGKTLTNHGASGAEVADLFTPVYTYGRGSDALKTLMIGTNDAQLRGTNGRAYFRAALLGNLAWLTCPTTRILRWDDAALTYAGPWANAGAYGGCKRSDSIGSSVSGSVAGRTVYVGFVTLATGEQTTVEIDGVSVFSGAVTPLYASTQNGLFYGISAMRFTGLSRASHTVKVTHSSGTAGNLYFAFMSGAGLAGDTLPQCCLIPNIPYQSFGGEYDAYNAIAADVGSVLRGDGLNLIVVNPYSWFVSADFKDALHLDYSGHSKLAGGIAAALGITVGRYLPAAATGLAKGMQWYDPAASNVVKFVSA